MSDWETVRGAEVRKGDLLSVGGRLVRVDRLEPYTHPDPAVGSGRIAHYESPYSPGSEDGILLFDRAPVRVSR